jgi:cobalamin biosynthesis Mg chelatase CobN
VHVIVLNVVDTSNSVGTEVEIFVLDPTSTSPLPDKAFSSENLKNLILIMQQRNLLPYTLKYVGQVKPQQASGKKESTSKAPVIAGVIIAVLVLIGLVFAIWMYNRRRKNKK